MPIEPALIAVSALVLAAVLTAQVRRMALLRGVIDVPNERSSHQQPTPRSGGIAILIAANLGLLTLWLLGYVIFDFVAALVGGGLAVATIGFLDDRRSVSPRVRLVVHVAAALWALAWLGGLPPMRYGSVVVELGWTGYVLGVLGIVWTLNLFNFMDGIDGIAASEAIFITAAGAALHLASGLSGALVPVSVLFAAASFGFLLWNWPPAKIFMGDVGSGYLGYTIAVLALVAGRDNPIGLLIWVILGGVFFVDATVTLVRRVSRRESFHEAHRSHAYQWLARRWQSHKRVTVTIIAINVLWLLPCAYVAASHPELAGWTVVIALLPIVIAALLAGAGRRETPVK